MNVVEGTLKEGMFVKTVQFSEKWMQEPVAPIALLVSWCVRRLVSGRLLHDPGIMP